MKKQTLPPKIGRRRSLALLGGLSTMAFLPSCSAQEPSPTKSVEAAQASQSKKIAYDLNNPKDQLLIFEKLKGDLSGKMTYSFSEGRVFGIRPDQPDDLTSFGKEVNTR